MEHRIAYGVALALATTAGAQVEYDIVDLTQVAGGLFGAGYRLNEAGRAVGYTAFDPDAYLPDNAMMWDDGIPSWLGFLPGDNRSTAMGVNEAGMVVGVSSYYYVEQVGHQDRIYDFPKAAIFQQGYVVNLNDQVTGGPALWLEEARDVSDAGLIVGTGKYEDGPRRGYVFDGGVVTDIGIIGASDQGTRHSYAYAINNHGQVVGEYDSPLWPEDNGHRHAFVWERGVMTDLHHAPGIGGLASRAMDVNDWGWIVGEAQWDVSRQEEPTVWRGGVPELLGNLGYAGGIVLGVSNRGEMVGITFKEGGLPRAVIWRDGEVVDLTELIPQDEGWAFLTHAWDITEDGRIVGVGQRNGAWDQVYMLVPRCRADFDHNGTLNLFDFLGFQSAFGNGSVTADLAGPYGVLNLFDFLAFQTLFGEGC